MQPPSPVISHLLVDFGQVLSRPQADGADEQLAALCGADPDGVTTRYWAHRLDYDLGQPDVDYWSAVAGRSLSARADVVEAMTEADARSWLRIDTDVLDAVVGFASAGHRRLAILSNAPHRVADRIDAAPWAASFTERLFSCRLGLAKPDPAVYAAALDVIGATPSTTLFVDDRADNVEAAAGLGIHVHHFSTLDGLVGRLDGITSGPAAS